MENNIDENLNPEDSQETTPSVEETNPDESVSEDEKTQSDKDSIPYYRFKEKVDEVNEVKSTLETLKEDMETLKQQQPEKEEEEPTTWKEMEERAVSKAVKEMEGRQAKTSEADVAQERAIDKSFDHLQKLGNDITPDVKKQVLEQMIKTGNEDVVGNYLQIKDQVDKQIKSEQTKQDGFIPSSDKGADVERPAVSYESIRGKSVIDIVREAEETQK